MRHLRFVRSRWRKTSSRPARSMLEPEIRAAAAALWFFSVTMPPRNLVGFRLISCTPLRHRMPISSRPWNESSAPVRGTPLKPEDRRRVPLSFPPWPGQNRRRGRGGPPGRGALLRDLRKAPGTGGRSAARRRREHLPRDRRSTHLQAQQCAPSFVQFLDLVGSSSSRSPSTTARGRRGPPYPGRRGSKTSPRTSAVPRPRAAQT